MHVTLAVLVPLTILIPWLRMIRIGSRRTDGTVIGVMPIPLLARIYMHMVPVSIALLTATAAIIIGVMPWWVLVLPILAGVLLVAVPLKYSVTDKGFCRTFGRFRRWTEFAGVERAHGGARLKPLRKSPPARVWLSGSRGDDEFLQLMRTLIRNAYQGRSELPPFPGETAPEVPEDLPTDATLVCAAG